MELQHRNSAGPFLNRMQSSILPELGELEDYFQQVERGGQPASARTADAGTMFGATPTSVEPHPQWCSSANEFSNMSTHWRPASPSVGAVFPDHSPPIGNHAGILEAVLPNYENSCPMLFSEPQPSPCSQSYSSPLSFSTTSYEPESVSLQELDINWSMDKVPTLHQQNSTWDFGDFAASLVTPAFQSSVLYQESVPDQQLTYNGQQTMADIWASFDTIESASIQMDEFGFAPQCVVNSQEPNIDLSNNMGSTDQLPALSSPVYETTQYFQETNTNSAPAPIPAFPAIAPELYQSANAHRIDNSQYGSQSISSISHHQKRLNAKTQKASAKLVPCPECDKKFEKPGHMRSHQTHAHSKPRRKVNMCPSCHSGYDPMLGCPCRLDNIEENILLHYMTPNPKQ